MSNTKYFKLFSFTHVKFQINFRFKSFKFADHVISLHLALIQINADIMNILFTSKHIFRAIKEILKNEISSAVNSMKVLITTYLINPAGWNVIFSQPPRRIWYFCRKTLKSLHFSINKNLYSEDITIRWRDEDIRVSSFSLYYVWRNDLLLYNRTILAIILVMFIYLKIVVI